jgi:hypothetical protein
VTDTACVAPVTIDAQPTRVPRIIVLDAPRVFNIVRLLSLVPVEAIGTARHCKD